MGNRKILILENVDHLEDRFNQYLNRYHKNDEIIILDSLSIGRRGKEIEITQKEIVENLKTPGLTDLMMESTFSNINQLLKLAGALVKFKDEISFREITVMYSYSEFDIFLNKLISEDKVAEKILGDLFDIYKVNCIEYKGYEKASKDSLKPRYFTTIHYYYCKVEVKKIPYKHLEGYSFEFEHSTYIDPREHWRPTALIPFNREVVIGLQAEDFFNEVKAMLEHQKEIIEESPENPDHIRNKKVNENNLGFLNYLRLVFLCEKYKQEEALKS